MVVLAGLVLLVLVIAAAVALKKRGLSGGQLALFVAAGIVGAVIMTFGILVRGFSGFG
jgi:hypothetical protein